MLHAWLGILNTNKKPSQDYLLQGLFDSKSYGPVRLGGEPATLSMSISQKNPRLSWVFSYCSGVGRSRRVGGTGINQSLLNTFVSKCI
jgi:hypothetical protein